MEGGFSMIWLWQPFCDPSCTLLSLTVQLVCITVVSISFVERTYSTTEGSPVRVCATLMGNIARNVDFSFVTVSNTALVGKYDALKSASDIEKSMIDEMDKMTTRNIYYPFLSLQLQIICLPQGVTPSPLVIWPHQDVSGFQLSMMSSLNPWRDSLSTLRVAILWWEVGPLSSSWTMTVRKR